VGVRVCAKVLRANRTDMLIIFRGTPKTNNTPAMSTGKKVWRRKWAVMSKKIAANVGHLPLKPKRGRKKDCTLP